MSKEQEPIKYFLCFAYNLPSGQQVIGNSNYITKKPIRSISDVRTAEQAVATGVFDGSENVRVVITNFQRF